MSHGCCLLTEKIGHTVLGEMSHVSISCTRFHILLGTEQFHRQCACIKKFSGIVRSSIVLVCPTLFLKNVVFVDSISDCPMWLHQKVQRQCAQKHCACLPHTILYRCRLYRQNFWVRLKSLGDLQIAQNTFIH